MNLKKVLLVTTILSLFSEACRLSPSIDLKLFYLVIFVNFGFLVYLHKIFVSRMHIFVLSAISLLSLISLFAQTTTFISEVVCLFAQTTSLMNVLYQLLGISIVSVYYYNFFRYMDLSVDEIFSIYAKYAYYVALIGILIFGYNLMFLHSLIRVKSIMTEPAHFIMVILPALHYYLNNKQKEIIKVLTLLVAVILSGSALGYLGILLSIFFRYRMRLINIIIVLTATISIFACIYTYNQDVRLRVDDTVKVIMVSDLSGANLSTYALMSNFYVAFQSFKNSPLFGGGLGSHVLSHNNYINNIRGVNAFSEYISLNSKDASSLLLRIISDFGVIGVVAVLVFILRNRRKLSGRYLMISNAILIYFIIKLFREGHYFPPEMYFFVFIYVLVYNENRLNSKLV